MPLPKIDQPLFELTIPSTGKKAKYRPFTVKEEKILLIAQESKDMDQVILAIKQIITNCLPKVDPDSLAIFDLEYIMLQLRAKAVNNMIEFKINVPETEEEIDVQMDINEIDITRDPNHKDIVNVTDDIVLKLKYPTIDYIKELQTDQEADEAKESELLFNLMRNCIESVVQGETVYKLSDFTDKEVEDFIDGLGSNVITAVKDFFDTVPQMRFEYKYVNKNGTEQTFVAKGTETFFI